LLSLGNTAYPENVSAHFPTMERFQLNLYLG
jgi:hypothetical protein